MERLKYWKIRRAADAPPRIPLAKITAKQHSQECIIIVIIIIIIIIIKFIKRTSSGKLESEALA